jgi:hypothetical protein
MNTPRLLRITALLALSLSALQAGAQVPGEDPVILKGKLSVQMQYTNPAPKSGNLDPIADMSASMRARISTYEARAFSADTSGILTDNDAVKTATAQGMQRTCVQEIGSNTAAPTPGTKFGPAQQPQIVVLRGDLVNICK